jgi:quercetin dioxygenase-like cupin family protein
MEQMKDVALRMRGLREFLGLEPPEAAERAGVPLADYLAYETGERDFSFSHLFNIAAVLGVDITDLLTGESPRLHGYALTRSGEGLAFDRRAQYQYRHLAYNFRGKKAEPFIVTVLQDAPGTVKQAHAHEGQELNYVLEGYLRIELGGQTLVLAPGDSLYYDSSLPHAMYAVDGDCRFVAVVIK